MGRNNDDDISVDLQAQVRDAAEQGTPLRILGGDTKAFYGRRSAGRALSVSGHRGVTNYEPTELVITARAGTPLAEVEATLAEKGQVLAFEPPHFGPEATLGGIIACGLSGPRRPYAGAARDFVLGTRVLNGRGEILRFGGEVMKNVAGYDVSRLMVGALGTLGVLLDISLKVLPKPASVATLMYSAAPPEALAMMSRWAGQPLPLSAACCDGQRLYVRLSGAAAGIDAAQAKMGGEVAEYGDAFWQGLKEHTHPFFADAEALWRLSVPPATPPLSLAGSWLYDWGGAQRWLKTDESLGTIRVAAADAGGHALLFRGGDRSGDVFHPLSGPLLALHRNLKKAFDPRGIFNPGRMYPQW